MDNSVIYLWKIIGGLFMKKRLSGVLYIILLLVFLLAFGLLSRIRIRPSENNIFPLFLYYFIYVIFGALLGLPNLIKTIKSPGKLKSNILSVFLSAISFAFLIFSVFTDYIHLSFNDILCNSWYLVLILLGYSLINIVKKEPVAQISK